VNAHVREALGLTGSGQAFIRYEAGDFTETQKKRIDSYEVGQDVRFGKDYRSMGIRTGEVGKVANVDRESGTVKLVMNDGRTVAMTPRTMSGKGHEIGTVEGIELAAGDRIRITGNALKKEGITNGMRGEVRAVEDDRIMVRFDTGREAVLPVEASKPLEIDHGYAQTGHSAQGLGAKTVILDLPSGSRTLNRRSFYTNLTRTKGEVIAFTDDREALLGAVTRVNGKTMAMDVEKKIREEKRRRPERKRETSPETGKMADKTQFGTERTKTMADTTPERAQKTEKADRIPNEEKGREKEQGREQKQERRRDRGMGL
jgi:hypothetical protein